MNFLRRDSSQGPLAAEPEVIHFDEPFSALDPGFTAKVEEAAPVSDYAAFIYPGEIIEFDDTALSA